MAIGRLVYLYRWYLLTSQEDINILVQDIYIELPTSLLYYRILSERGTMWHSWLRHCDTSRKVTGSIVDGVIIFPGAPYLLELIQPLTEINTRNISWGVKAAGTWGWQPYHLHVPIILNSGSLNLLEVSRPVQACNGIHFYSTILYLQLLYIWYNFWQL